MKGPHLRHGRISNLIYIHTLRHWCFVHYHSNGRLIFLRKQLCFPWKCTIAIGADDVGRIKI